MNNPYGHPQAEIDEQMRIEKVLGRSVQWLHTCGPGGGTSDGDWLAFPGYYTIAECLGVPLARFSKLSVRKRVES